MAYSKTDQFDQKIQKIAEFAKALSHPARIAILLTLVERKSCICGEIVEVLPLAQSTVSQHLKELQKTGLITGEIEGPKSCYCIDQKVFSEYSEIFIPLLKQFSTQIQNEPCE